MHTRKQDVSYVTSHTLTSDLLHFAQLCWKHHHVALHFITWLYRSLNALYFGIEGNGCTVKLRKIEYVKREFLFTSFEPLNFCCIQMSSRTKEEPGYYYCKLYEKYPFFFNDLIT